MTLDGFLTFLTIVIAAYAVVPPATRLRFKLRKVWLSIYTFVALVVVLYLEFAERIYLPCPVQLASWCGLIPFELDSPETARKAAFIVVAVWMLVTAAMLAKKKIRSGSLVALSQLASELNYQQRYSDLVSLVEPQLDLLTKAINRQALTARLHDKVANLYSLALTQVLEKIPDDFQPEVDTLALLDKLKLNLYRFISELSHLIPSRRNRQQAAESVFRILFQEPSFVRYVATYQPEFGVKLLKREVWGVQNFSESFFVILAKTSDSLLYKEVRNNQNLGRCGYAFPPRNRILHYLLSDANQAYRLGVWKPIGDYMLSILNPGHSESYINSLNRNAGDFHEREKWHDPVFVGLSFFDLMVKAAACQGVRWHMWLYYYPDILERIVKVYNATGDDIDLNDEWPTRASYLIYTQFSQILDWIEIVKDVPDGSPHKRLETERLVHENGNIPKSAAIALGSCLNRFILATSIPVEFRTYIHDIVLRRLRDMHREGPEGAIRRVTIASIVRRGPIGPAEAYGMELTRLWSRTDPVVRLDLRDYEDALLVTYGSPARE